MKITKQTDVVEEVSDLLSDEREDQLRSLRRRVTKIMKDQEIGTLQISLNHRVKRAALEALLASQLRTISEDDQAAIAAFVERMNNRGGPQEVLAFVRNRLGMTSKDLAEILGDVHPMTVSKYLRGTRSPTAKRWVNVWQYLLAQGWFSVLDSGDALILMVEGDAKGFRELCNKGVAKK